MYPESPVAGETYKDNVYGVKCVVHCVSQHNITGEYIVVYEIDHLIQHCSIDQFKGPRFTLLKPAPIIPMD